MGAIFVLALALGQSSDPAYSHIRSSERQVPALLGKGLAQSATFRRLVATIEESDVIVYIQRRRVKGALGGYLLHTMSAAGDRRYVRIAIDVDGADRRLISLLAHELQHVVEVVQAPEVRDTESLRRLFARRAIAFGCGEGDCYETQEARDVEAAVLEELRLTHASK